MFMTKKKEVRKLCYAAKNAHDDVCAVGQTKRGSVIEGCYPSREQYTEC